MEPETKNMMTLRQEMKRKGKSCNFSGLLTKMIYEIRIMSQTKVITFYYYSNLIWRTVSHLVD